MTESQPARAARFSHRVVVVTGAGAGIGADAAAAFAAEGARVVAVDISLQAAQATTENLPGAIAVAADISDSDQVQEAYRAAIDTFGRVDVVFNNAAIDVPPQPLHEVPDDLWHRVQSVNSDGFFFVLKYGIRALISSGGGSVVSSASTAGLRGYPGKGAYTFSKAGIIGITRSTAVECAPLGIRVNAVAPGATLTPLYSSLAGVAGRDPSRTPMDGIATPRQIVDAVLFLASDEASRITGQTLAVDGGFTAY